MNIRYKAAAIPLSNSNMNYSENKKILQTFYDQNGLSDEFENDSLYLENAFNGIYEIWVDNFQKIKKVNYLMIAEAPLWGKHRNYIYNPETKFTQFFYKSDLESVLNREIGDKKEFIDICNEIGLLILDISPFPFNSKHTIINYSQNENDSIKLSKKQYQELVRQTIPTYFELKIKAIAEKKSENIKTFFRYARVKLSFENIIEKVLSDYGIIQTKNELGDISQIGGGVDRKKLKVFFDHIE